MVLFFSGVIWGNISFLIDPSLFNDFIILSYLSINSLGEIDAFFEFIMCRYGKVLCFNPPIIGHRDNMVSTITNAKWKSRKF